MSHETLELTPAEAAEWLDCRLDQANSALLADDHASALDAYVSAVGLALQLGPGPARLALMATLNSAHRWAHLENATALSALGPALVDLSTQVRSSEASSCSQIMEAWLTVTSELGALVGQIGLAVSLPPVNRLGMLSSALARATCLDDATNGLFSLVPWLESLLQACRSAASRSR